MDILIVVLLTMGSGLFSGLTIGLMGLSKFELDLEARRGNKDAAKILPVIYDTNLLLVTLLLGNTAINSTLSIYLGTLIGAGLLAGVIATAVILIFGEILPASIISKHAIYVGARVSKFVLILIKTLFIITKPIAWTLDTFVGVDYYEYWSKDKIKDFLKLYLESKDSSVDELDFKIFDGVLDLDEQSAGEHMTRKFSYLSPETKISLSLLREIKKNGHTRIPVIKNDEVIGILLAKDLLGETEGTVENFMINRFFLVKSSDKIDDIFSRMQKESVHISIVTSFDTVVGILTMEDIIEEIIGMEITDESDR